MQKFIVRVKIDAYRSTNVILFASNQNDVRPLAEAQYGAGNVISFWSAD